jgi:hypothetical protein
MPPAEFRRAEAAAHPGSKVTPVSSSSKVCGKSHIAASKTCRK